MTLRYYYILIPLILFSCVEKKADKKKEVVQLSKSVEIIRDEIIGLWRIDSVQENNIIIDRLNTKENIQAFNFNENGGFSTFSKENKKTEEVILGDWEIIKDSVYIFDNYKEVLMSFYFEKITDRTIVLKSNHEVSSSNSEKPSFYLSRYVKDSNSKIFQSPASQ